MICSSCGTTNPAGSVFCMSCGSRLAEAAAPAPSPSGDSPGWAAPVDPSTDAPVQPVAEPVDVPAGVPSSLVAPEPEGEDDYPMADFAGPPPDPEGPEPADWVPPAGTTAPEASPGWGGAEAAAPDAPEAAQPWAPAAPVEPAPSWAEPAETVPAPVPDSEPDVGAATTPVAPVAPATDPEPSWAPPVAAAAPVEPAPVDLAPPTEPEPSWAAPTPPAAAPAAPAWQPPPAPVPTPGDPAALAVSAGRLAPTAAAAARTALVVTAAVLVPGEVVEAVATGSLSGVTGVIVLSDRRLLAVNQQDWTPVVTWFSVDAQLSVQAWEDAQSATVVLTSGGSSITLDHITDRTPAYDLVARVRTRTGQA